MGAELTVTFGLRRPRPQEGVKVTAASTRTFADLEYSTMCRSDVQRISTQVDAVCMRIHRATNIDRTVYIVTKKA